MPRRLLIALTLSGAVVLTSCGTTQNTAKTPPVYGREFVRSGTFVVTRAGVYTVTAVGAGGGGGGGGSALTSGGISDQVGGAGGAAGAVTINSFIAKKGERFAVVVGMPGSPGAGGAVNGGSGMRGGAGGISSCAGIASADGGSGGAGSPGNSDANSSESHRSGQLQRRHRSIAGVRRRSRSFGRGNVGFGQPLCMAWRWWRGDRHHRSWRKRRWSGGYQRNGLTWWWCWQHAWR